MGDTKKQVRQAFREAVFKRDRNACRVCSAPQPLDAHHITDRTEMPNGGYVAENGISLCDPCHQKAEASHRGEVPEPGFSPAELYAKIGSSYEKAVLVSKQG